MQELITSTSNSQIKQLLLLKKKAKERIRLDVFVAEGPKLYMEAPADRRIRTYVSESFFQNKPELFHEDRHVILLSDHVFECVSDTRTPQGVLCIVRQFHYELKELTGSEADVPLIVALENLQDPGNLGTIVRTAEGAGVTGVLLGKDCVDMYNPKVVRSTMGSVYRMPFYYTENFREDLLALGEMGVRWYAAAPGGAVLYDLQDYAGSAGFIIGNESRGLTEETAALADVRIRIPMCGRAESLNAAAAASVLVYEAYRQRRRLRV